MGLHIVLVEPEIPQNTGNIARTCAAVGAALHLVHPLGFSLESRYVRRAGLDYWDLLEIHEYSSFSDFLAEKGDEHLVPFTTKAEKTYSELSYPQECYLVFGRESKGLSEEFLKGHREYAVRIPMIDSARSLNLSNSAAVAAYEYLRQHGFPGLQRAGQLHESSWD